MKEIKYIVSGLYGSSETFKYGILYPIALLMACGVAEWLNGKY